MLEAQIKIDHELAVKGFRRALRFKAFQDISYFYAVRLMAVWLVVSLVNALWDRGGLTTIHLIFLAVLWLIVSIHDYYKWHKELAGRTEGWEFIAKLDDGGVATRLIQDPQEEVRQDWDFYQSYRDYEDYIQINDTGGGITFLPKTPGLKEIIEFTKNKIPEK